MRIQVAVVAATVVLSGALSGCATVGLGAARPATSTTAATGPAAPETIISAMDGGLIGGSVGAGLSGSDRQSALQAEYRALEHTPAGKAVDWKGSNGSGAVTAAQPYRVGSQDCRQYTQTVVTGGQSRSARGTACRNADGSWTPLT
jgi:surface antigen